MSQPVQWRVIGALELAGVAGVLAGLLWSPIGIAAAIGLALLSIGAVAFHLRASDRAAEIAPAVIGVALARGDCRTAHRLTSARITPASNRCLRLPKFSWSVVYEVAYAADMATRTHSVDPRAERVRTLLRDAAFALAHEAAVDEITVGDIVARAGVSRQVFYRHFTDRDDAVATAFTVAFAVGHRGHRRRRPVRITGLFDFAAEHRAMYRNVVPSAVTQRVVTAFRAELAAGLRGDRRAGHAVVGADRRPRPRNAVSRFLVGGFQEVLRSWMEDPDATDLRGRVTAALDTVDALLGTATATPVRTEPTPHEGL